MKMSVRMALSMTLALAFTAIAADGPPPTILELFPGLIPAEGSSVGEEKVTKKGEAITSITNVSKPTLTISRPSPEKNTGVAVLVFPGGGYNNLAWQHEGTMVAEWLNSIGVTAAILKYRVPRRAETPKGQPPSQALMDAQRAVSLVRSHASEWGINPEKIGVLGFSAGGHLAAWCSTNSQKRAYETIDGTEQISCRPDFTVLIYPGGMTKGGTDQLSPEIRVTRDSQPTFLAVAGDDNGPAIGSAAYYLALKRAGVPAELHVYASGGHGFGMRPGKLPTNDWPRRCEDWMREQKIITVK